jgi:transcriptional regulator with XRE-family HTH domain
MNTLVLERRGMEKPFIATRLKSLRVKANLTQQQLAFESGLSMALISQIEQGKKNDLLMSTVQALGDALGVDCTAFVEKKPRRLRKKGE